MTPTIPEAAVQNALDAFEKTATTRDGVIAALTAALPFMTGVKVKDEGKLLMDVTQAIFPEGWTMSNRNAVADGIRIVLSAIEPSPSPRAQALEEKPAAYLRQKDIDRLASCQRGAINVQIANTPFLGFLTPVFTALSHPVSPDMGVERPVEGGWLPIETAPRDGTEVLAWRYDSGPFIASFTSCSAFPMSQAEIDEIDEDTLFKGDWFTQWPQALRLEGSEVPTHWRPLPQAPGVAV